MKFKLIFLTFVLILLAGSVYAFSFSDDNLINNLVNSLGLNKPFLKHEDKIIIKEKPKNLITAKALITTRTVTSGSGACGALDGICIDIGEECPLEYWFDPSLSDACSEKEKCCTPNIIYLDSIQAIERVYIYGGISLIARIDSE